MSRQPDFFTETAVTPERKVKNRSQGLTSLKTYESHKSNTLRKKETSKEFCNLFSSDFQDLDEMVKSMMEKGRNKLPHGRQPDGKPKHEASYICKVCGKENVRRCIMKHIENKHVEGISIQCDICGKTFSSRDYLRQHKLRLHK